MGSLMAGWDSPLPGSKSRRNRLLTKEEIATFWRLKKSQEEELYLLKASYRISKENQEIVYDGSEKIYKKANPIPQNLIIKEEESMEALLKKHGWWVNSSWAFLNEPPKMSLASSYNYVAQFDVACKHIDKINLPHVTEGIST